MNLTKVCNETFASGAATSRTESERVAELVQQDERCQRLAELPGVGPLTATAVVASVGNAREFRSGRELAAFFGLVPRHRASGRRTVTHGHAPDRKTLRSLSAYADGPGSARRRCATS